MAGSVEFTLIDGCGASDERVHFLLLAFDQRAIADERLDLTVRKSGLAQNFAALLAKARRIVPDRGRRLAPGCRGTCDAQGAFGRMFDGLNRGEPPRDAGRRSGVEVVERRMRDVGRSNRSAIRRWCALASPR